MEETLAILVRRRNTESMLARPGVPICSHLGPVSAPWHLVRGGEGPNSPAGLCRSVSSASYQVQSPQGILLASIHLADF